MLSRTLVCAASPLYAFTTSTIGHGDLRDWQEVSNKPVEGLQAADEICRERAAAAHLSQADDFVAWLSDRDNDAYCRVLGLTGKRSANCGTNMTLGDAGPWFRTDGTPFSGRLSDMTGSNVVYSPLAVDEHGQSLTFPFESFTATNEIGTLDTTFSLQPDCEHWSSASDDIHSAFAPLGWNYATGEAWTRSHTAVSCSGTRRLMCFQKGIRSQTIAPGPSGRREAFVTSMDVDGNLAGVSGADTICRQSAAAAGLYRPQTFKALIAASSIQVHALNRYEFDGPWFRTDGMLFAHGKDEIAMGKTTTPLNVTENSEYIGYAQAYTGALSDGTPFDGHDCSQWSGTTGITSAAVVNLTRGPGGGWLDSGEASCSQPENDDWPHKLVCLADGDVLFHSGFGVPNE